MAQSRHIIRSQTKPSITYCTGVWDLKQDDGRTRFARWLGVRAGWLLQLLPQKFTMAFCTMLSSGQEVYCGETPVSSP